MTAFSIWIGHRTEVSITLQRQWKFHDNVCHSSEGLNNFLLEDTISEIHQIQANVNKAKRSTFRQPHWKFQSPSLPYHFRFNLLLEAKYFFFLTHLTD